MYMWLGQHEDPAFCTALNRERFQIAAVHTELDLSIAAPTGEGYQDHSAEALIVRPPEAGSRQSAGMTTRWSAALARASQSGSGERQRRSPMASEGPYGIDARAHEVGLP